MYSVLLTNHGIYPITLYRGTRVLRHATMLQPCKHFTLHRRLSSNPVTTHHATLTNLQRNPAISSTFNSAKEMYGWNRRGGVAPPQQSSNNTEIRPCADRSAGVRGLGGHSGANRSVPTPRADSTLSIQLPIHRDSVVGRIP